MRFATLALLLTTLAAVGAPAFGQSGWTDDAQRCYRGGGDPTLTIRYCTQAIESGKLSDENLSITYVNRGGLLLNKGEVERALADYNTAVRLNSDNSQAYVARGRLYRFRGEENKAQAEFDHAIGLAITPNQANGYLNRARAYRAKGDLTSALADLDTANQINTKLREVYVERAAIYAARRMFERAIGQYDEALHLNSGDADLLDDRGDAYRDLGDLRRALADYDSAISLQSDVATYYADRAWIHRMLGDPGLAITDYSQAIRLEPGRGNRLQDRAAAYQAKGDWRSAMADYDRAIQVEPDRGTYLSARAEAREYEGDYAGALADRDEAIRLEPRDADWRVDRAWTLLYAGRTDDALAGFADAIGMDPVAQRYRSRGSALLVLGRFDEALPDFDRAIEAQPSRGVNYAVRANVFLYRGQPLDGLKDISRAEAADPEYAGAAARAKLLMAGLQLDDAIREYAKYIDSRPNSSIGFFGRGFARMLKGDLRPAAEDFRRALDFNAWDSETVLWLHWCRGRLGEAPNGETARHARRFDPRKWPGPAFRFALGRLSLDSMLAAARDPSALKTREQEAQAYFFAGEHYLATRQRAAAQKMFQAVLARKDPWTYSDIGARGELARSPK